MRSRLPGLSAMLAGLVVIAAIGIGVGLGVSLASFGPTAHRAVAQPTAPAVAAGGAGARVGNPPVGHPSPRPTTTTSPAAATPTAITAVAAATSVPTATQAVVPTTVGVANARTPAPTASPAAAITASTATPSPGAAPVAVTLSAVDPQPTLGGVTVTVSVADQRQAPLAFQFDPANDVTVRDARGKSWPLRWAQYRESENVAPGATIQLTRAFFAGDAAKGPSWPLTIAVYRVPGVPMISWKVGYGAQPTIAAQQALAPLPTVAASGPVGLTAQNAQPSSQLGGVQVDLYLRNQQTSDLVFQFDPNAQLSAVDNLGRLYNVRWAQYNGTIRVAPDASIRLARVFFSGPVDNGSPAWLRVTMRQTPNARPVESVVSLQ